MITTKLSTPCTVQDVPTSVLTAALSSSLTPASNKSGANQILTPVPTPKIAPTMQRKIACPKCNFFFTCQVTLNRHMYACISKKTLPTPTPETNTPTKTVHEGQKAYQALTPADILRSVDMLRSEQKTPTSGPTAMKKPEKALPTRVRSPEPLFAFSQSREQKIMPKTGLKISKDQKMMPKAGLKIGCAKCGKIFNDKESLNKHIATVHDKLVKLVKKPNDVSSTKTCEECDSTFVNEDFLIKHITKVHEKSEEKPMPTASPYEKGYNTSGYYINSTSPNASPKICCGTCGEIFQSEDILNEHITKVHPTLVSRKSSSPKAAAPKTWCEKCDTQFVSEDFLKKHISKSHSKYSHGKASPTNPTPPAFTKTMKQTCEKCDTTFVNEDFLNKHIAKVHPESVEKPKPGVDTPTIPSKSNLPMPTPEITKSTSPKAESKICCGKCGVAFQSEDVPNKHIAIYHEKSVEKHTPTPILPTSAGAPTTYIFTSFPCKYSYNKITKT